MSRYGIRAVFDIAYNSLGLPVLIRDISERQQIPSKYLEQIFHKLKKVGVVEGTRGPRGGYVLARDPNEITVGDIIRGVNEPINPVFCVDAESESSVKCSREEQCVTRLIWKEAGEKMQEFFDAVTINSLCERAVTLGVKKDVKHQFEYTI